jgi:hypothetical protein
MSRTSLRTRGLLTALVLAIAAPLAAQPAGGPPSGPADIMNRAAEGRARKDVQRAASAGEALAAQAADGGAPPVDGGSDAAQAASPEPHRADDGHDHGPDPHKALAEPELPTAEPNRGSTPGTIEVLVIGPDGAPARDAEIVLGVMASIGARTEQRAKSDAQGRHVFRDLAVGTQQAYRVNVLRDGAKFSSTPFRLTAEEGYRVRVPLRATTADRSKLFQVIGQTVLELRDDRLHVTQQARLANVGERIIVLPSDGLLVPLPEGYTAFTWQEQMTDQKGEDAKGKGFRLRGSIPPGSVTLAWTFDLPRSGESARIQVAQPWRSFTYRVISEAPDGLKLRVSDFPEPEKVKDQQRDLLFTQVQRSPSDPELGSFTIKLDGLPGPGPGRWIAALAALLAIAFGVTRALRPADDLDERKALLAARKQELIELAKSTESEHDRGDIGPAYRAERLNEIMTELALVLRDEESLVPAKK